MPAFRLRTQGMTCANCESKLVATVLSFPEARVARADFVENQIDMELDSASDLERIKAAIVAAGYSILDCQQTDGTALPIKEGIINWRTVSQLAGLLALAALVLFISPRMHFDLSGLDSATGYGALFLVGLFTSVHCIGMCGGISMAQCMSYKQKHSAGGIVRPSLMYNTARLLSYTMVGALAGTLGSAFNISHSFKGTISVVAGLLMMIMGFNLLGLMGGLRRLIPRLPSFSFQIPGGKYGPVFLGLLTGFMPCGPLQAMQLYALSTGSPVSGALAMFFFALGTFPAMFAFGSFSSMLSGKFTSHLLKASGALVIILGVLAFDRGMGFIAMAKQPELTEAPDSCDVPLENTPASSIPRGSAIAVLEDGYQTVVVAVGPRAYQPVVVQRGIPIRMTFVVPEGNLNGCNNAIIIPAVNLEQRLAVGETELEEFTLNGTGELVYACWMNMIRSTITVVQDVSVYSP